MVDIRTISLESVVQRLQGVLEAVAMQLNKVAVQILS
jgi:hypothetical protein